MAKPRSDHQAESGYKPGFMGWAGNQVNDFMRRILKNTKSSVSDYCPVFGVADDHTLFLENGGLFSVFRMTGISYLVGETEQNNILENLEQVFTSALREENSAIQIIFQRDRRRVKSNFLKHLHPLREKAKSLKLDMDTILDEQLESMFPSLSGTEVYCAVYTYPMQLVSKDAMKDYVHEKLAEAGPDYPMQEPDGIHIYMSPDIVLHRHASSVRSLENAFKHMRMGIVKMTSHDAVKIFREFIFPEETSENWKARLPGDPIHPRMSEMDPYEKENLKAYIYPSIGRQVAAGPVSRSSGMDSVIKVGARYVTTYFVNLLPASPRPFDVLIDQISDINMPVRFSIMFYGGADYFSGKCSSKKGLAYLASFTWPSNRKVAAAAETLSDMVDQKGEALCGVSISLSTWADDHKTASERGRKLGRSLDAWGDIQSSPEIGDPFLAFTSTVPGWADNLRVTNITTVKTLLKCLPMSIVASPWSQGTTFFKDKNGGIFPFQPLSSIQQTANAIAFAPPGGGKSVMISRLILGAVLDPVLEGMPKVAGIDIGNSSKGIINLLRAASPLSLADRFIHVELELSEKFGINVCDIRLGNMYPTSTEQGFLANFLTMILTPVGRAEPINNAGDLASIILKEAYQLCAEDEPQPFEPSVDHAVTEWINQQRGFTVTKKTTWWQIVFFAMDQRCYDIAAKAQRYAVPNIRMLPSIITKSKSLNQLYGDARSDSGDLLLTEARRLIMGFIEQYPSLVKPSVYAFQEADVCVIDLNKVTQDTGPEGVRKTTIAYMVARYLLGKDFLANRDIMSEMSPYAQEYYRQQIQKLEMVRKYLIYDEFHRTKGALPVRRTVVDDMRNGRKFNLMVMLASQTFEDFDEDMIKQSTLRFVMRVDSPDEAKTLSAKYGWSDSVRKSLSREVRGAGENGATFLLDASGLKTSDGVCTQVLTSLVGPTELAAYGTERENAALRDALIDAGLSYWDSVSMIGKLFPRGVKKQVEETMRARRNEGVASDDQDNEINSALAPLIKQVMETHHRMKIAN